MTMGSWDPMHRPIATGSKSTHRDAIGLDRDESERLKRQAAERKRRAASVAIERRALDRKRGKV